MWRAACFAGALGVCVWWQCDQRDAELAGIVAGEMRKQLTSVDFEVIHSAMLHSANTKALANELGVAEVPNLYKRWRAYATDDEHAPPRSLLDRVLASPDRVCGASEVAFVSRAFAFAATAVAQSNQEGRAKSIRRMRGSLLPAEVAEIDPRGAPMRAETSGSARRLVIFYELGTLAPPWFTRHTYDALFTPAENHVVDPVIAMSLLACSQPARAEGMRQSARRLATGMRTKLGYDMMVATDWVLGLHMYAHAEQRQVTDKDDTRALTATHAECMRTHPRSGVDNDEASIEQNCRMIGAGLALLRKHDLL